MPEDKKKYDPEVKFGLGERIWVKFRFDKPVKSQGRFGEFYNWGVEKWVNDGWQNHNIKPTTKLRLLLLNIPIKVRPQYEIVKLHEDEGDFDYFEVWRRDELPDPQVHSTKNIIAGEDKPESAPPETPPEEVFPPQPPTEEDILALDPTDVMQSCANGVCGMMDKLQKKYTTLKVCELTAMIDTLFINKMKNDR